MKSLVITACASPDIFVSPLFIAVVQDTNTVTIHYLDNNSAKIKDTKYWFDKLVRLYEKRQSNPEASLKFHQYSVDQNRWRNLAWVMTAHWALYAIGIKIQ